MQLATPENRLKNKNKNKIYYYYPTQKIKKKEIQSHKPYIFKNILKILDFLVANHFSDHSKVF